jgi:hypothetical protein
LKEKGVNDMSKVNDSLWAMLDSGKKQTACAKYFGVSDSAISQWVKKKRLQEPPDSFLRLSPQDQTFVICKLDKKLSVDAAEVAFSPTTRDSAKSIRSAKMADPDVQHALRDLMFQQGIGRRVRIDHLKQMILSRDMSAKGKGLDLSFRIGGELAPIDVVHTIQYDPAVLDARIAELRELLAEAMRTDENVINIEADSPLAIENKGGGI